MNTALRLLQFMALVCLSGCVTITSTDRKRIVDTPNGRFSFELPSPAGRISEHYRLAPSTDTSSFGYGEYHFDLTGDCNLALQTIVRPKNDVRNSNATDQLKAAIADRQRFDKPPPSARELQSITIRGYDVSIIELVDVGSRSLRAEMPLRKGSIVFYISERYERPEADLLTPFEEILRSVRIH